MAAAAEAMEEPVVPVPATLPAPCALHDDRLRSLERESADHGAQLRVGTEMFNSIRDTMTRMERSVDRVAESVERVGQRVDGVANNLQELTAQVGDLRVKQATQEGDIAALTAKKVEDEEEKRELRKTIRGWAFTVGKWIALVALGSIATKYGVSWLQAIVKMATGG